MGGEINQNRKLADFFFFFLPETWTMTAESGKNEGVNRSDYKGGLMVLTVPV